MRFYSSKGGVPLSEISLGTFNVSVTLERDAASPADDGRGGMGEIDVSHRLIGTRWVLASWDASQSAHASFTDLEIVAAGGNLRLRYIPHSNRYWLGP